MSFLDTDVLVDLLRQHAPAHAWFDAVPSERLRVPGIARMEVVLGCPNAAELNRALRKLASFQIIWPDAEDLRLADDLLVTYHLRAGIGIADCIIAAMALRRGMRLYSFNRRHYSVVDGLDHAVPYERE